MSDRDHQDSNERGQFGGGYRGSDNQANQWQTDGRQQGGNWQQDGSQRGANRDEERDYRFSGQGSSSSSSSGNSSGNFSSGSDGQRGGGSQGYGGPQRQRPSSGGYGSQLNDDDQRDAARNYEQSRSNYGQHNDRGQQDRAWQDRGSQDHGRQDWQTSGGQSSFGQRGSTSGYRIGNYDASGGNDFSSFTSEDFGGRDFSNRGGAVGGGIRSSESYRPSYGLSSWFNNDDDDRGGAQSRSGRNAGGEDYGDWRHYGESRGFLQRAGDEVASWFGDDEASRRREQDHRNSGQGQGQSQGQSHRGRGPSNYTRSDERIREDANDHLTHDHHVDASHITVSVKDGELTLDGTVDSRAAKRRAEDAVEHISGVKHVQNNLRMQDGGSTSASTSGSYGSSSSGSNAMYDQSSGQTSSSGVSGQLASSGASGSSTDAASSSTAGSGTSSTPGSSSSTPGQTGASTTGSSTTGGIGSTATAGVGGASAARPSDKTS